jgi:hypothetical protein
MAANRAIADARLKMLNSEVVRGVALYTLGRSADLREESRAMRAEIRQRRLAESRMVRPFSRLTRLAVAPR